jgi:hypothetical protein
MNSNSLIYNVVNRQGGGILSAVLLVLLVLNLHAAIASENPATPGRETYDGYQTFPNDKEELLAIIRERDLHGATQAYMWTMAWATNYAWLEANLKIADLGDFVTFVTPHEKRDIITSNMTTPYAVAYINLRDFEGGVAEVYVPDGPTAGIINDMQMRLIADTGQVGADQGKGATYLIVGPEGEEPAKHNADFIVYSKTNLLWVGTRILVDDDKVRNRIFSEYKINEVGKPSTTKVVSIGDTKYRGSNLRGMAHWKEFHWIMQQEPFNDEDAPFLEFLRRVGLEKGKPFNPTERQKEILAEAEEKGFAMSVAASIGRLYDNQLQHAHYYAEQDPNNRWTTIMNVEKLETHIDPTSGALELDGRTSYTHEAYSMSNAMRAEIVGAGSKYLAAYEDADGDWLNSANSYILHVPADVPAELFWSLTGYNGKTRAMVYTDVKEINSRQDIHINDDGTTYVYLSSTCDKAPFPQNCIDISGQGDVFAYFRWYSPTEAYFDKSWVLPNIQKIGFL